MRAKRDYYDVLGVDRKADLNKIKSAFRRLAKKYHPDRNANDPAAADKFKEVTEAYDVLKDEKKRKLYDQYGFAAFDENGNPRAYEEQAGAYGPGGPFGGSTGAWSDGNTRYRTYTFHGDDFPGGGFKNGSFEGGSFGAGSFSDLFGDLFGAGFSGQGAQHGAAGFQNAGAGFQNVPGRGSDAEASLEVGFEEAAFGSERTVRLTDSTGHTQSLKVHIPAGIESGKKIRLKGKGGKGRNGGPNGDLYIRINVASKSGFERKGSDVYSTVRVPYATAALGGQVVVPTLEGSVRCRLKEGTQAGTKIRLKGRGAAQMGAPGQRGDQYVTIEIQVPRHLTPKAKEKLKEFQQAAGM